MREGAVEVAGRRSSEDVRPDHLLVWLQGIGSPDAPGEQVDPPVHLDDELADGSFSVIEWVHRVRTGYPDAVACVVHGDSPPGSDWVDVAVRLVRAIRSGDSRFTGDTLPTDPARFRRWTRAALDRSGGGAAVSGHALAVDDVVLIVDELVNNAEEHAGSWVTVDLVPAADGVLVAVSDPSPERPATLRVTGPEDSTGRGMLVVSRLAPLWGVLVAPTMKTVWAWLPSPGRCVAERR
jgi:hypothetical protein